MAPPRVALGRRGPRPSWQNGGGWCGSPLRGEGRASLGTCGFRGHTLGVGLCLRRGSLRHVREHEVRVQGQVCVTRPPCSWCLGCTVLEPSMVTGALHEEGGRWWAPRVLGGQRPGCRPPPSPPLRVEGRTEEPVREGFGELPVHRVVLSWHLLHAWRLWQAGQVLVLAWVPVDSPKKSASAPGGRCAGRGGRALQPERGLLVVSGEEAAAPAGKSWGRTGWPGGARACLSLVNTRRIPCTRACLELSGGLHEDWPQRLLPGGGGHLSSPSVLAGGALREQGSPTCRRPPLWPPAQAHPGHEATSLEEVETAGQLARLGQRLPRTHGKILALRTGCVKPRGHWPYLHGRSPGCAFLAPGLSGAF